MATQIDRNTKVALDNAFKRMCRVFGLSEGNEIANVTDIMNNSVDVGDSTASPGNATLNFIAGSSAIAAGASAATITSSFCAAGDLIMLTPLDTDATLVRYKAVAGAGSFVVTGNANATAIWKFQWLIVKKAV
jgi:hypothetical protein